MKAFWVGVQGMPPQTVFEADAAQVTAVNYPQFAYVVGPFLTRAEAEAESRTHVNADNTFTDPFCNNGGGR